MSDTPEVVEPDMEAEGWDGAADGAPYPEYPANPHNHRYTVSIDSRGPMLVVRGNTSAEVKEAFEELEDAGTGAAIGRAWAAVKAGAALGNGLGATPAPPAPAGPQPPAPAYGAPAPPPPPAPAPQGYGGQGGNRAEPKPRPAWPQVFKISIARGDNSFKEYRAANQQYFKGKVMWAGGGDYWIHGDVVQSVAQWHPVPA